MSKHCSICYKDLHKWKQLDFGKDIVCNDCTDARVNFVAMLEKEFRKEILDFRKELRKGKEIKDESLGIIRNAKEYEFAYQLWIAKLEKIKDQNKFNGKALQEARKSKGLSLESLATYLDISRSYLCKIEKGQKPLSNSTVQFIKEGISFPEKSKKSLNTISRMGK